MHAFRHRVRRSAGVVFLAVLLLVPVALSRHTHLGPATHSCPVCAITHHAPIATTTAPPPFAAWLSGLVSAPRSAPARIRTDQAPRTGRAPPSISYTVVA